MAGGKLTALAVRRLAEPGHYGDGGGLYLRIGTGRRSWMFRYQVNGKTTWIGLGPERDVTLAEARDLALDYRRMLRNKIDPLKAKRATAAEAIGSGKTFRDAATEYVAKHKAGWKNAKHGDQWTATLKAYAFGVFGDKPVAHVQVDDIMKALQPIWITKSETASRVRGRIEAVLDYAKVRGWRAGENPARWKGHLDHLFPAKGKVAKVKHHAALPWPQMPAVMAQLRDATHVSARCLCFTILTAARAAEARSARWREIDLVSKVWTVPAERMKGGNEHRVPLADAAIEILQAMEPLADEPDSLIFPGQSAGKPLSDVAVSKSLRAVAPDVTVHGMRSTFRDWAAEKTAYPREVAEAALAHVNKDRVEAAYRRSDLFDLRAGLMRDWSKFCMSLSFG